MPYAMLGPFDAADAKLLLKKVKLGDPIDRKHLPSIVMENVPLHATQSFGNSRSYHFGGKLVTILYAGTDAASCETVSPFSSYYMGRGEPLAALRDGIQGMYEELGSDDRMDTRFRPHIGADELVEAVERFYASADGSPCAVYHAQTALRGIGIKYSKYDDEFLEDEQKATRDAANKLRASGKLKIFLKG